MSDARTLREKIAERRVSFSKNAIDDTRNNAINDVLAILDKHELTARDKIASWSSDQRNGEEPPYVLAIVEAIEAHAAHLRVTIDALSDRIADQLHDLRNRWS